MKRSFACIAALTCLCGSLAQAQDYPTKAVRLIVGFPAGGGSDIVARIIAQRLEAGVAGHTAMQWNGLLAPARTPQPVLDRLHRAWMSTLKFPDVSKRIVDSGAEPAGNSAAEFAKLIRAEIEKWAAVAKASGTKLD